MENNEPIKRENKIDPNSMIMQKFAAMFSATKDIVGTPKIFVDMVGDLEAAMVLDELFFWTLPKEKTGRTSLKVRKEGVLWLKVSRSEWWDRKRLNERQSDLAIKKLVDLGLVEKEIFKYDSAPQVHLRVLMDKFFELFYPPFLEWVQEEQEQGILEDINDLYAMMGLGGYVSNLRFHQNVKSISPNGDTDSPNGEIINSTQTVPNEQYINPEIPEKLTEEEYKEAGDKVIRILSLSTPPKEYWKGREFFHEGHYEYADWYHGVTNQICVKRYQKAWQKAFSEWQDAELKVEHLQAAYDEDVKWRKFITDPNELTKKAIAIKASAMRSKQRGEPEVDDFGAPISY